MYTGMPTENQEIFRALSSGEYVYVGYSGRQINEEQILVSTVYENHGSNQYNRTTGLVKIFILACIMVCNYWASQSSSLLAAEIGKTASTFNHIFSESPSTQGGRQLRYKIL
jgi:hypothetical protein